MALKKSDLYSSLWKSCDELRGGMDASQYKDYILTLLFVSGLSHFGVGSCRVGEGIQDCFGDFWFFGPVAGDGCNSLAPHLAA